MKLVHKSRLRVDLEMFCCQIGILPHEVPTLFFNRQDFYELADKHSSGREVKKGNLGLCDCSCRAILVDGNGRKRTYREYLRTLVHELVHYRFNEIPHGKRFQKRIDEIFGGAKFPPKHVHFFESYRKKDTLLIWGYSNEEIEKRERMDKRAYETRCKNWNQRNEYWNIYYEAEDIIRQISEFHPTISKYDLQGQLKLTNDIKLGIDESTRRAKEILCKAKKSLI